MKKYLLIWIIALPFLTFSQNNNPVIIHFENNSFTINKNEKTRLDSLILYFTQFNIEKIQISGHTDNVGDSLFNIELSNNRCESVKDYLKHKLTPLEIDIIYYGENLPLTDNSNESKKAINRRVEIRWGDATLEDLNLYIENIDHFYDIIQPNPQVFTIDNRKDNVIVGDQGTGIYVFAKSLDNEPKTKIRLTECYSLSSMLLANLNTININQNILMSNGMLKIETTDYLNKEQGMVVFSPSNDQLENIRTYYYKTRNNQRFWFESNTNLDSIDSAAIQEYLNKICTETINKSDTVDSKCPLFFCKIFNFLGIKKYQPEINTSQEIDTIDCPMPRALTRHFKKGLNKDELKKLPKDALKYYLFNVNRDSWANLDWLWKINRKVDFKVLEKPDENLDIKIVFKEERSIIPLRPNNGYYHYDGLPLDQNALLLAFKIQEGQVLFAKQEITITKKRIKNLDFQKISIDDLYEELKTVDFN